MVCHVALIALNLPCHAAVCLWMMLVFITNYNKSLIKKTIRGWRDDSVTKNTGCSFRGPEFTALPEVLSSIPSNHMAAHNHL